MLALIVPISVLLKFNFKFYKNSILLIFIYLNILTMAFVYSEFILKY